MTLSSDNSSSDGGIVYDSSSNSSSDDSSLGEPPFKKATASETQASQRRTSTTKTATVKSNAAAARRISRSPAAASSLRHANYAKKATTSMSSSSGRQRQQHDLRKKQTNPFTRKKRTTTTPAGLSSFQSPRNVKRRTSKVPHNKVGGNYSSSSSSCCSVGLSSDLSSDEEDNKISPPNPARTSKRNRQTTNQNDDIDKLEDMSDRESTGSVDTAELFQRLRRRQRSDERPLESDVSSPTVAVATTANTQGDGLGSYNIAHMKQTADPYSSQRADRRFDRLETEKINDDDDGPGIDDEDDENSVDMNELIQRLARPKSNMYSSNNKSINADEKKPPSGDIRRAVNSDEMDKKAPDDDNFHFQLPPQSDSSSEEDESSGEEGANDDGAPEFVEQADEEHIKRLERKEGSGANRGEVGSTRAATTNRTGEELSGATAVEQKEQKRSHSAPSRAKRYGPSDDVIALTPHRGQGWMQERHHRHKQMNQACNEVSDQRRVDYASAAATHEHFTSEQQRHNHCDQDYDEWNDPHIFAPSQDQPHIQVHHDTYGAIPCNDHTDRFNTGNETKNFQKGRNGRHFDSIIGNHQILNATGTAAFSVGGRREDHFPSGPFAGTFDSVHLHRPQRQEVIDLADDSHDEEDRKEGTHQATGEFPWEQLNGEQEERYNSKSPAFNQRSRDFFNANRKPPPTHSAATSTTGSHGNRKKNGQMYQTSIMEAFSGSRSNANGGVNHDFRESAYTSKQKPPQATNSYSQSSHRRSGLAPNPWLNNFDPKRHVRDAKTKNPRLVGSLVSRHDVARRNTQQADTGSGLGNVEVPTRPFLSQRPSFVDPGRQELAEEVRSKRNDLEPNCEVSLVGRTILNPSRPKERSGRGTKRVAFGQEQNDFEVQDSFDSNADAIIEIFDNVPIIAPRRGSKGVMRKRAASKPKTGGVSAKTRAQGGGGFRRKSGGRGWGRGFRGGIGRGRGGARVGATTEWQTTAAVDRPNGFHDVGAEISF